MSDESNRMKEFETDNEPAKEIGYNFKDFINGQFFSKASLSQYWPYILFLVFLAFVYINNHYSVEKLLKKQVALTAELQELKYEAITTSSELMQMSRQSEVVRKVQDAGLGLEVLKTPPRILKVKK